MGSSTSSTGTVTTGYDAQFTTVTDQAGKLRRSNVDGLGRLVRVDEPDASGSLGTTASPNQATSYTYDALANLTQVSQGVQTRTFAYSSLARLTAGTNPESGTISYTYDNNGNLTSKLDARSITTTIAYDALNRPTSKSYNDSPQTPTVNYYYDSQTLPLGAPSFDRGYAKGRLVGVTYGTGSSAGTYRGYDALGRALRQYQQTDSVNYLVEATYNRASGMATETYPSVPGAADRRTVTYTPDMAGRLASLSSTATSYAPAASVSSIGYAAHNGLSTETYGSSLVHAVTYNPRLQPNEIKLGTSGAPTSIVSITYNYGTTNNNGNVQSIGYAGGGLSYTQTFGYDELNRLSTSQEGLSWSQTNSYDRYGNRSVVGSALTFSATNNRITTSGYSYDAAGNLTNDGAHAYTFDAENKISKVDNVSAYVYDGEGQRVRKLVNENLRFIYDMGGKQIAEFDGSSGSLKKEYVYGASGLVATIEPTAVNANGTRYTTSDHLGSPRVVTNSSAAVASRHDYMPFGEELFNGGRTVGMGYGAADGLRQKFTSKERDNETGLDYFLARYYSSTQGRFSSPDEFTGGPDELYSFAANASANPTFYADLTNPQSLNKYQYSYNNPLRYTDADGHCPECEQLLKDTVVGGAKGVANTVIDASNTINTLTRIQSLGIIDPGQIQRFEASTTGERGAMIGVDIGMIMVGSEGALSRAGSAVRGLIGDLAGAAKIESKMATVARLGREGEAASGIVKNTDRIPSATGTAKYRVPDGMNSTTIQEVKNTTGVIRKTNQIEDFMRHATKTNRTFELIVNPAARLDRTLAQAHRDGNILVTLLK